MKLGLCLIAGAAAFQTKESAKGTAMARVIELFKKMEGQLTSEQKTEDQMYQKNRVTAAKHLSKLGAEIKAGAEAITDADNNLNAAKSELNEAVSKLPTLAEEEGNLEDELAKATKQNSEEQAHCAAVSKEMTEDVAMLGKAHQVLKQALSFAQKDGGKKITDTFGKVADALALIGNSAKIGISDKAGLASLIQDVDSSNNNQADDDDDESFLQQPQSKSVDFENKSGGILKTIKQMQDDAEDTLQKTREGCVQKKNNFEMAAQNFNAEMKAVKVKTENMEKQKVEAQQKKGKFEEKKRAESVNQAKLVEDQKKSEAATAKMERGYVARKNNRNKQLMGITKAIQILGGRFGGIQTSFLQLASSTDPRSRIANLLQESAQKFKDLSLAELAQRVKEGGPFDKILGMIKNMVATLEKKHAEEADAHAWCETNKAKNEEKESKMQKRADTLSGRISQSTSEHDQTKDEMSEMTKELAESQKNLQERQTNHLDEVKETEAEIEEATGDIEALGAALTALTEAGLGSDDATSFIQLSQPDFESVAATDQSAAMTGPLAMVEDAKHETELKLDAAKAFLATINSEFDKFKNEQAVNAASKKASLKGMNSELASLRKATDDSEGDLENVNNELEAVREEGNAIRQKCTIVPESYAERARKRQAEIGDLKKALSIIESLPAGGSSFLQRALGF